MSTIKKAVNMTDNFQSMLSRSNAQIKKDRSKRFAAVANGAFDNFIGEKNNEIMLLEDELETMMDMSADNRTTTLNILSDFDATKFVKKRAKLRLEIKLKKQELLVYKEDEGFYNI